MAASVSVLACCQHTLAKALVLNAALCCLSTGMDVCECTWLVKSHMAELVLQLRGHVAWLTHVTHRAQTQLSSCSEHPDGDLATVGCHNLFEGHLPGVKGLQSTCMSSAQSNSSKCLQFGCSAAGVGTHLETIVVGYTRHNIPVADSLHIQSLNAWLLRHSCWYQCAMCWWAGALPTAAYCRAYIHGTGRD